MKNLLPVETLLAELGAFGKLPKNNVFHREWTQENQEQDFKTALNSPLFALHKTSDVNDIESIQIDDARRVLRLKRQIASWIVEYAELIGGVEWARLSHQSEIQEKAELIATQSLETKAEILRLQRRIVKRFIDGRRNYFEREQSASFDEIEAMAKEKREIFIIIKFMDEAPHIRATLKSLVNQKSIDMERVVIVAVDNNSTDGSDKIVKLVIAENTSRARIIYTNQPISGGGSAARFGVDRIISTIYEMCLHDNDWERLERAIIAVSDGDTVYHPQLLADNVAILNTDSTVDGVMPFLTYKYTAALRLFAKYTSRFSEDLRPHANCAKAVAVPVDLSTIEAYIQIPRHQRRVIDDETIELIIIDREGVETIRIVKLNNRDALGRKFAALIDNEGHLAYVLSNRTIVLDEAPVSGTDAALVYLENDSVKEDEKWRWHAVIGHDLFLSWAFEEMGLPEESIFPDTSDALKMFRVWSFAVGGQHQLKKPDLNIVTGTDYQSGRVLQAVGNVIRLGPAHAYSETEIDRLIKMIRNFAKGQSVFYGETRSSNVERASGLYLHMTRIQNAVENEVRNFSEDFFREVVFPERIIFPLRWILQNAVRFYAHKEPCARDIVEQRVLNTIFSPETVVQIKQKWITETTIATIRSVEYINKQKQAEKTAEGIIKEHYREIMSFYKKTLQSFFDAYQIEPQHYSWLLEGVEQSRNALVEDLPRVHPSAVWQGKEFVIDNARGQVLKFYSSS
ncbi:hypothetical protein XM38_038500 [Halomicronema hongdechloris C2206]|uniref:Glycosyltransferase 2-like domain-containing protein n=1 Tax=Halomicronema hongdechloris C2206 TaxID=1641165 RepID=A0A1Z3HRE5_9CYAN|nr:glycosyltransferase family A protein [Halomicronema hongdechloris]ASC72890.1 hypothetical protein XM38_038500 [Halomicronema hongdechloris C2206]